MVKYSIYEELEKRILVLDGGLGTMIQGYALGEKEYRGERFAAWKTELKGCNDLLALTAPEVIGEIHRAYLRAGADIVSTDSFNANAISLADYGLGDLAYEISREAARTARRAADEFTLANPSKPRFVAGSMGPTNRTASISADVNNPAAREVTFVQLAEAYADQARGLLDGGADLLLVETVFDTLNAKAALWAIDRLREERGGRIPVMLSGTLADASGRTLSGQTVEAFYVSVSHADLLSVGFNCAFGARQLRPYLARLAAVADCRMSAHPNAGLPNVMGGYDETPQMFAADVEEYLRQGLVNIIGGCCGTTPRHIAEVARIVPRYAPRPLPHRRRELCLSGLEPLRVTSQANFINVGERTNVAGSAKFARLIRENRYEEALSVARAQVEAGAQIVDVCMDDGMIDGVQAMTRFLNLAAAEPEIARVPFMIDSSKWEVLEAGLRCVQGKSVVNSVSLKEGEESLLRRARMIHRYGAAAVVMLFDERGQADTFDRKVEVARRAYDLLTGDGFPAEDIIFDPNILSVATGIEQHDNYGRDFIEACRWIKSNLPGCKVSGGVSNLSFSFRGHNRIREAMHSVFLYHAVEAGMDMGIVNPAMLQIYSDIEPRLLELCEDVVLNRRRDATERLAAYAEELRNSGEQGPETQRHEQWRDKPLQERIAYAVMKGVTDCIEEDILEAYRLLGAPLGVIDRMLMPAMERVGELFGEGKMFLPQVVKSARVMKRAVSVLTPFIEEGAVESTDSGKVLIATVKGDVHDIGKNIVSVVMACNGYRIRDLGVMVESDRIADEAAAWGADVICLSGLITPSLDEMINVVRELERRGMKIPVVVGGATTSPMHTAVKIAPAYSGVVVQSRDASANVKILSRLLGPDSEAYVREVRDSQAFQRQLFALRERRSELRPLEEARAARRVKRPEWITVPQRTGRVVFDDYPIAEVEPFIDWNFFFSSWGIKGHWPDIFSSPKYGEQARRLYDDARRLLERIKERGALRLQGVVGIFPAVSEGDDIVVSGSDGTVVRLPQLRNQSRGEAANLSLADFVIEAQSGEQDYVGLFAVSAGIGLEELAGELRRSGDDYQAIMAKLLADRLTEAFAEVLHSFVRRVLWGYETGPELTPRNIVAGEYRGLRMAFGYPASPDHSLKREAFELLGVESATGMTLTDNYMIRPGEALCGMMFADRDIRYFSVGKIDDRQLLDYAARRGIDRERMAVLLPQNL